MDQTKTQTTKYACGVIEGTRFGGIFGPYLTLVEALEECPFPPTYPDMPLIEPNNYVIVELTKGNHQILYRSNGIDWIKT